MKSSLKPCFLRDQVYLWKYWHSRKSFLIQTAVMSGKVKCKQKREFEFSNFKIMASSPSCQSHYIINTAIDASGTVEFDLLINDICPSKQISHPGLVIVSGCIVKSHNHHNDTIFKRFSLKLNTSSKKGNWWSLKGNLQKNLQKIFTPQLLS